MNRKYTKTDWAIVGLISLGAGKLVNEFTEEIYEKSGPLTKIGISLVRFGVVTELLGVSLGSYFAFKDGFLTYFKKEKGDENGTDTSKLS